MKAHIGSNRADLEVNGQWWPKATGANINVIRLTVDSEARTNHSDSSRLTVETDKLYEQGNLPLDMIRSSILVRTVI